MIALHCTTLWVCGTHVLALMDGPAGGGDPVNEPDRKVARTVRGT